MGRSDTEAGAAGARMVAANTLYYGDNLDILGRHVPDESVDLVYLDPPFNSKRDYNVLFREKSGEASPAQIEAFTDSWAWDRVAERTYDDLVHAAPGQVADAIAAVRQLLGKTDLTAYLVMMAARLVELHRVLRPTGSLYLHCDPTASHYLKIILDSVFGKEQFLNEVIWKRTGTHSSARRWGPVHDVILFYAKDEGRHLWNRPYLPLDDEHLKRHYRHRTDDGRRYEHGELTAPGVRNGRSGLPWRGFDVTSLGRHWTTTIDRLDELFAAGRIYLPVDGSWPRLIRYEDESKGRAVGDVWTDIPPLNMKAKERLGYPTQKPLALLERIIEASSDPGDVVLDPFCGCGTAVVAAQKLGRHWLGIDITHLAINLMRNRLVDSFPGITFEVVGEPRDLGSARALAEQSRYQFQWWALSLVGARPAEGREKKGADRGIDGIVTFVDDLSGKPKRCLVQVKSGGVSSAAVRDLRGTVEREGADLGLLLTLDEPSRPMRQEAAEAGHYRSEGWGRDFPRIQLCTVGDLLAGAKPDLPPARRTFQQAERIRVGQALQPTLLDSSG